MASLGIMGTDADVRWFEIDAGKDHTCGIAGNADGANKRVYCWGRNDEDQTGGVSAGMLVLSLDNQVPSKITAGENHSCAITEPGNLFCWGSNQSGQLGSVGQGGPAPALVSTPSTGGVWAQVAAGAQGVEERRVVRQAQVPPKPHQASGKGFVDGQ